MKKNDRQKVIQRILKEQEVRTQEDLVKALQDLDVDSTQATISRDIREMQLVKVPADTGGYRYSMPIKEQHDMSGKLARLLKNTFISSDIQDNLVVIYTTPGNAMAIGNLIHEIYKADLFTTMTNDDRVLLFGRDAESVDHVRQNILSIL